MGIFRPRQGKRANDKLLLFHLIPAKNLYYDWDLEDEGDDRATGLDLGKMRDGLIKTVKPHTGLLSSREYKRASAQICQYARLRARGLCEFCNASAPFTDMNGFPYLEVHHTNRLADDGPDVPGNVAALCPNCHRRAHFSQDKGKVRDLLESIILKKEMGIEKNSQASL